METEGDSPLIGHLSYHLVCRVSDRLPDGRHESMMGNLNRLHLCRETLPSILLSSNPVQHRHRSDSLLPKDLEGVWSEGAIGINVPVEGLAGDPNLKAKVRYFRAGLPHCGLG